LTLYDLLGIDPYETRLDEGAWINIGASTNYTFESLSQGVHIICAKAVDKAGNTNTIIYIDHAPCDWFKSVSAVLYRFLATISTVIVARTTIINMRSIIIVLIPKGLFRALSS